MLAVGSLLFAGRARAAACGLPDGTLWIDYDDYTVPNWQQFAHPGVIVSTDGEGHINDVIRAGGGEATYWDMHLWDHVGTPSAPAAAATVDANAAKVYDIAVRVTRCSTPVIAENELWGAQLPAPWSPSNARYRANVLAYLRDLARRGAQPVLFLSQDPATGDAAGAWLRKIAGVSEIVRETFLPVRRLAVLDPVRVSRFMRVELRREVRLLTAIGIATARLGVLGEFESGSAGRDGLASAQWWELVKLQALAMKQVAGEFALGSVWSWGWGTFGTTDVDPDKPATACVWLWARNPSLCNAPSVTGGSFDLSLDEGQLTQIPTGGQCSWQGSGQLPANAVRALAGTTANFPDAEQLLLDQALLQPQLTQQQLTDPATDTSLARSEQAVVDDRFDGSRHRFLAALNRVGLIEPEARLLLANQLRIRALGPTPLAATVAAVSLADALRLLRAQPSRLARLVRLLPLAGSPAPSWLAGWSGYALAGLAPPRLFRLLTHQPTTLYTPDGAYRVLALDSARPVSALPTADRARLARMLQLALTREARARAIARMLAKQEQSLAPTMLCLKDILPTADAGRRLLRRAAFLRIAA